MRVIDTNMWVDFVRQKTPREVRAQVRAVLNSSDRWLCEPIIFEVLRAAPPSQRPLLDQFFAPIPVLPTPSDLWTRATELGQRCYSIQAAPTCLDLLIAQVCIEHGATVVTFDGHFGDIANVSTLQVERLARAI